MVDIIVLQTDSTYDSLYGYFNKVVDGDYTYYEVTDRLHEYLDSYDYDDYKLLVKNENLVVLERKRF